MPKQMPKKQAAAFERCMKSFINALALSKETGQMDSLLAAADQIKAYEKEYNATVRIDEENRRLYQVPN